MTIHDRLPPGKYRLKVDDYTRLSESGVFGDARTELIAGEIIVMAPEYRPHGFVRDEFAYRLRRVLEARGSDLYVASGSVRLSDTDMPQPDIVLTSEPRGEGPIPASSVALLVEVSSTTLAKDMGEKAALYASTGVTEYWVVNVTDRIVHQFWDGSNDTYAQTRTTMFGEALVAATIKQLVIETARI